MVRIPAETYIIILNFRLLSVDHILANIIQMKSSITFIQSNGWTEIDLILKQIWRRFIWRQVSFKVKNIYQGHRLPAVHVYMIVLILSQHFEMWIHIFRRIKYFVSRSFRKTLSHSAGDSGAFIQKCVAAELFQISKNMKIIIYLARYNNALMSFDQISAYFALHLHMYIFYNTYDLSKEHLWGLNS